MWFTKDERGLILNKTNNRTLRGAFGDRPTSWDGQVIVVFPTMAPFRGKMVPAHLGCGTPAAGADNSQQHRNSRRCRVTVQMHQQQQRHRLWCQLRQRRRLPRRCSTAADPELEPDP